MAVLRKAAGRRRGLGRVLLRPAPAGSHVKQVLPFLLPAWRLVRKIGLGMGALCIAKGSYVSAGGEEMSVWYHKRQVDICVSGMRYGAW